MLKIWHSNYTYYVNTEIEKKKVKTEEIVFLFLAYSVLFINIKKAR